VTETIAPPVQEVTETIAPPVHEVTGPVHEVTEAAAPVAKEATEKATAPAKEVTGPNGPPARQVTEKASSPPVTGPVGTAAHTATTAIGTSPGGAAKNAGTAAHEAPGTDTHAVPETVGSATRSARSGPASAAPDLGPGDDTFEAPAPDGAVRAPLPKWLAYVWPAFALTGGAAMDFVERWEQNGLRLVLSTGSSRSGAGARGAQAVAGVHASGGQPGEAKDASSSPFPSVAYQLGHFPSDGPGWILTFLIVAAMLAAAAFAAMRWERSHHRHQGSGQ
jgi:hypothetical protein